MLSNKEQVCQVYGGRDLDVPIAGLLPGRPGRSHSGSLISKR